MTTYRLAGPSDAPEVLAGFTKLYQVAFAGPPYFETYSDEEVRVDVWTPHIEQGIVVLAMDGDQVVGLGCAMPYSGWPEDVRDYVAPFLADGTITGAAEQLWYMSELAVLPSHRMQGMGRRLVEERLSEMLKRGGVHYVMRTDAKASNSAHLYVKIGSKRLGDVQHLDEHAQVVTNGSASTARLYLFGHALAALAEIAGPRGSVH